MADFARSTIQWGEANPKSRTLLEILKGMLNINLLDTSRDEELSMILEMAGTACERYADTVIDQREVTERHRNDNHPFPLSVYPVVNLVLVEVDGEDVTTDYEMYYERGLGWFVKERCSGSRDACFTQMDITYMAGWEPVPADLGFAICRAAVAYDRESVASGPIKKQTVVGVGSIEFDTSSGDSDLITAVGMLPASTIAVLEQYKRLHA